MSLISFHRILIAAAILFCVGYAVYELVAFARDGGNGSLEISGFFFVSTAALTYYLWHLKRTLGVEEQASTRFEESRAEAPTDRPL